MASAVLGKRARAPEQLDGTYHNALNATASTNLISEPSSISSRVKKRNKPSIVNDENADPGFAYGAQYTDRYGDSMELDELDDPCQISTKSSKIVSTPVKHTVKTGRIPLSPVKILDQFKTSKLISSRLRVQ